ncbi:MAG: hypothetical protein KJO69_00640 [Gammaproteobacteria bacterium]|nr:hypothetical protein [Gammaproteobacteria bacterium]
MAITKNVGRQEVISAAVTIGYADVVDATAVEAINLPEGAIVVGGALVVREVFNSATSDTIAVAVNSEALLAATDVTALGSTLLTAGSAAALLADTVDVTWDGTGAVPTTGSVVLIVNYVVEGRAAFSEG